MTKKEHIGVIVASNDRNRSIILYVQGTQQKITQRRDAWCLTDDPDNSLGEGNRLLGGGARVGYKYEVPVKCTKAVGIKDVR